ncbi:MAG: hypothetical protein U1F68_05685 [Gammaproteobacteria bacterium]
MSNSSHSLASPYFYNIEIVRAEQWFGEDTILGIAIQDLNIKGELERGAWVALDRHGALTAYSGSEFDRLFKSCLPGLPNIEMGGNGVPLLGMRDTDTAERPPRVRSSALGAMLPKSRELLSSYAIIVIDDQATGLLLMQQYAAQVLPGDVTVKPFQDPDQALAAIISKRPTSSPIACPAGVGIADAQSVAAGRMSHEEETVLGSGGPHCCVECWRDRIFCTNRSV